MTCWYTIFCYDIRLIFSYKTLTLPSTYWLQNLKRSSPQYMWLHIQFVLNLTTRNLFLHKFCLLSWLLWKPFFWYYDLFLETIRTIVKFQLDKQVFYLASGNHFSWVLYSIVNNCVVQSYIFQYICFVLVPIDEWLG